MKCLLVLSAHSNPSLLIGTGLNVELRTSDCLSKLVHVLLEILFLLGIYSLPFFHEFSQFILVLFCHLHPFKDLILNNISFLSYVNEFFKKLLSSGVESSSQKISLFSIQCVTKVFIDVHNLWYVSELVFSWSSRHCNVYFLYIEIVFLSRNVVRLICVR